MVESLAMDSIGQDIKKEYQSKSNSWAQSRRLRNKSSWLCKEDGVVSDVNALAEFMTLRCYVMNIRARE